MASRARPSKRIAASYPRNKKTAPKLPVQTQLQHQLTVLNWEDVLVPMTWLGLHFGLGKSTESIQHAFLQSQNSPQVLRFLALIEQRIMVLLTEAMQIGPVFITSEFTTVYVELVSSLFFPQLTAALRSAASGIYVVGIPDTNLSLMELRQWKANLLQTAILEGVFAGSSAVDVKRLLKSSNAPQIGVVAICAGEIDMNAASAANLIAPNAIIKRLKVKPSRLEDFYTQFEALIEFVKRYSSSTTPVSINL